MNKTALFVGIIGGVGLGILLGSEYPGRYLTTIGAVLVIISIIGIGALSCKNK